MKQGWKVAMALAVATQLVGCATTIGKDYGENKVSQFVPGQTTVDQVVATLGQPQERETESSGETRLHYQHIASKSSVGTYIPVVNIFDHGTSVQGKDTFLYFDARGRYERAETNQSNT